MMNNMTICNYIVGVVGMVLGALIMSAAAAFPMQFTENGPGPGFWPFSLGCALAVAAVVLNRVRSPAFPNTIAGVIYQAGAFDAVADGQINLTPDEDSLRAARDALGGWDPSGGCLYYYNPVTSTNQWIWTRTVQLSIGKHNFAI